MATIKMEQECSRCGRTIVTPVTSYAEAAELEQGAKRREEGAKRIGLLFEELLKSNSMPDLVTYCAASNTLVTLPTLCDPQDAKRSCTRRTVDLVKALTATAPPAGAANTVPEAAVVKTA